MNVASARSFPGLLPGAWLTVALLWFAALLNYLDRLVLTTLREPILADLPMSEGQFGLLSSVFLWVYGLASPLCGYLADRFDRRHVLLASLVAWSVMTWFTGQAETFAQLCTARALMGFSEACYLPAALALIADHHRGATRSLATGLHNSGIYAGAALGGLSGYLAELAGWRSAFTLLGAIGVAYALILPWTLAPAPRAAMADTSARSDFMQALRSLGRLPAFRRLLAVNVGVSLANWVAYAWLPTYFRERFGLSLGGAGVSAAAALQVASFLGVLAGGWWADRWSARRPRALVPAIGYALAAPAFLFVGLVDSLALAVGALALFGLGRGCYDANLMPILRQAAGDRFSATGYGCLNLVGCVAGGTITYAGGVLRDLGVGLGAVIVAGGLGLGLVALGLAGLARSGGAAERQDDFRKP